MLRILRINRSIVNCVRFNGTSSTATNITEPEFNYFKVKNDYLKEFHKEHIPLTSFQKIFMTVGSSLAALLDPRRHEMIACLGETTGENSLYNILKIMRESPEGRQILKEQPRINSNTINIEALGELSEDTFGYAYYKFLKDNNVTPDSRLMVRFIDDPELAYIMTRYRETHDMVHTILNMPTNMLGEVAVKWIEALNIGLPMCYGGALFGAIRLRPKQRKLYSDLYLPWAMHNGKKMKPLMNVYWEKRWEQRVDDIRNELNITPINLYQI